MAYNLHIVRPKDFVQLDAHGKYDIEASRRVLQNVAKACMDQGISCALLDVRNVQRNLNLTELYSLARTFREMGFQHGHRLAVLHSYADTDRAEFFAMCASDRGWDVRAFDSFEEAIEWFGPGVEEGVKP